MQLTRFDRWLKVKFVQETHILTLRPLEHTPNLTSEAAQQTQLKQIFTDLREFEVGELSRLCISRDFFTR